MIVRRLRAAWRAFREIPDDTWVVVGWQPPVGYRLVDRTRSEVRAKALARRQFQAMTLREYRDLQVALIESGQPWRDIAVMQQEINTLRTEAGIARLAGLGAVANRHLTHEEPAAVTRKREP